MPTRSNIRIATMRGALSCPASLMVRLYSLMNPGVHTEIWFNNYRLAAVSEGEDGCLQTCYMDSPPTTAYDGSDWHLVEIPVTDEGIALEFFERVKAACIPYGIDVLECALPKFILDSVESDVDCCNPEGWDKVFCSQFALLFLRWCDKHNILLVPKEKSAALWTVNSRGCLPSRLQIITDMIFGEDN